MSHSETQVLDLIDELWNKYTDEPWLAELVEVGKGGEWLEKAAIELLATGTDQRTLAALRRGEHRG